MEKCENYWENYKRLYLTLLCQIGSAKWIPREQNLDISNNILKYIGLCQNCHKSIEVYYSFIKLINLFAKFHNDRLCF